jgi:SAM-dependent methyltransferase
VTTPVGREEWNRRYAGAELLWTARPNRFLVAEVGELPPGRALDLACGEGRNAVWLAERGWQVTGVDFADVALTKARNLAAARAVEVDWVQADLLAYSPERRGYDLVLLFYVQLPGAQRGEIVRAAAEGVAVGGTLLLVAHDSSNLEHGHGGPKEASVLYTAADVVADLGGSDLEIERAELVERPIATADGTATALDALVRARRP